MRPKAPFAAALCALFAVTALFAPPAAAPALAGEMTCRPNYEFCVEVDGKYPPDARFLTADQRGKFLVEMPSSSKGILIDLASRRAQSIPASQMQPDGADGVKVNDAVPPNAPAYALVIDGPILKFTTDSSQVRVLKVLDRPPLVGPISLDDLVADRIEYREAMKIYSPEATSIASIKQFRKPVEIEAYFGTWCPHCKMYMPKFLRVMKDAANPNIKLTLVGVPKGFGLEKGPWEGKSITAIPAIIVKFQGKEITRLASHEGAIPEAELAGILSALR